LIRKRLGPGCLRHDKAALLSGQHLVFATYSLCFTFYDREKTVTLEKVIPQTSTIQSGQTTLPKTEASAPVFIHKSDATTFASMIYCIPAEKLVVA